jgi:hypothetical protein
LECGAISLQRLGAKSRISRYHAAHKQITQFISYVYIDVEVYMREMRDAPLHLFVLAWCCVMA